MAPLLALHAPAPQALAAPPRLSARRGRCACGRAGARAAAAAPRAAAAATTPPDAPPAYTPLQALQASMARARAQARTHALLML
jgi:hypothetical protein